MKQQRPLNRSANDLSIEDAKQWLLYLSTFSRVIQKQKELLENFITDEIASEQFVEHLKALIFDDGGTQHKSDTTLEKYLSEIYKEEYVEEQLKSLNHFIDTYIYFFRPEKRGFEDFINTLDLDKEEKDE